MEELIDFIRHYVADHAEEYKEWEAKQNATGNQTVD